MFNNNNSSTLKACGFSYVKQEIHRNQCYIYRSFYYYHCYFTYSFFIILFLNLFILLSLLLLLLLLLLFLVCLSCFLFDMYSPAATYFFNLVLFILLCSFVCQFKLVLHYCKNRR